MDSPKKSRRKQKRARRRIRVCAVLFALTSIAGLSLWLIYRASHLKPAEEWFEIQAANQPKISLPADDAAHNSKIEWWYYNGSLVSESGRQYSFHDTIFLVNGAVSSVVGHASLNDHKSGRHYTSQQRWGGNPSVGVQNRFEFKLGDWLMDGGDGSDRLKIVADDFRFDLRLTNDRPAVVHGSNGIISMSAAGSSYYYSRPRMNISGVLSVGKRSEKVTGIAWFDHQWGDFTVGRLAWDWFGLQLLDGIDVMIYRLRDQSNRPVHYTASVSRAGETKLLGAGEFDIQPGRTWSSPRTEAPYPLVWTIKIPSMKLDIETRSMIDDCEFDARLTTYNYYWEGPVVVRGSHQGHGFMELAGYSGKRQ